MRRLVCSESYHDCAAEKVGRTSGIGGHEAGALRRLARRVQARVDLDEDRQRVAARADVRDLGAEGGADLPLDADVEVIGVRRLELVAPADDGEGGRERVRRAGHRPQRVGIGISVSCAVGVFNSMSGVNGGDSTPLWKKSPCPASAS